MRRRTNERRTPRLQTAHFPLNEHPIPLPVPPLYQGNNHPSTSTNHASSRPCSSAEGSLTSPLATCVVVGRVDPGESYNGATNSTSCSTTDVGRGRRIGRDPSVVAGVQEGSDFACTFPGVGTSIKGGVGPVPKDDSELSSTTRSRGLRAVSTGTAGRRGRGSNGFGRTEPGPKWSLSGSQWVRREAAEFRGR